MAGFQASSEGGNRTWPTSSIIILNFEDLLGTLRCLDSVRNSSNEQALIVVVDNGSHDGSVEIIRSNLRPSEHFIALRSNQGFAGGMKAGLIHSLRCNVRFALLLNNDTVLEPGVLDEPLRFMESHKDVGVCGPRIHLLSAPDHVWHPRYVDVGVPTDDPWLSGAALLVRMDALVQAGLFDEMFFLYWEDNDFFRRIMQRGWRVVYVPTRGRVLHEVSATATRLGGRSLFYFIRNEFLYKRRWQPGVGTLLQVSRSQLYNVFAARTNIILRIKAVLQGWILWLRNPAPRWSWESTTGDYSR